MIKVKVTSAISQKTLEGDWNGKFYTSTNEDKWLYRMYVSGQVVHITQEEKNRLENSLNMTETQKENSNIQIIKDSFSKLSEKAKYMLLYSLINDNFSELTNENKFNIANKITCEIHMMSTSSREERARQIQTREELIKAEEEVK